MVAAGMPVKKSRSPMFREYIRGFEARAVLPHHHTVHRIATSIDEVQRAKLRMGRRNIIRLNKGKACLGGQVDMWTDRNSGICYVALHDMYVEEDSDGISINDEILDFYLFPYTAHTSNNISTWLVSVMVVEELPAEVWMGLTPDGAADGVKGIKMVPGLANKVNVCVLHQLQRSVLYSVGMAGSGSTRKNSDARDVITVNARVTKLQHQSREVSDGVRDLQTKVRRHVLPVAPTCCVSPPHLPACLYPCPCCPQAGIPLHKVIGGVRSNRTRWNNIYYHCERNNVMRPILEPVMNKYKREHSAEVVLLEKETSSDDSSDEQPRGAYSVAARQVFCCLLPPLPI
jgi:hypothetical protein